MGEEFSVMFKGHYNAEVVVCMVTECHFSGYLIPERETQLCRGGVSRHCLDPCDHCRCGQQVLCAS